MERQRNWPAWAALALAALALLVALGGRFDGPRMAYRFVPAAPAAPAPPTAPRFERGHDGPPAAFADEFERGFAHPGLYGRGHDFGPHGRGHGFGPFGLIFGLVNTLAKLAALGLLAWLLLRLFQQRRNGAPPAAPTTPAGHDPRVE